MDVGLLNVLCLALEVSITRSTVDLDLAVNRTYRFAIRENIQKDGFASSS